MAYFFRDVVKYCEITNVCSTMLQLLLLLTHKYETFFNFAELELNYGTAPSS